MRIPNITQEAVNTHVQHVANTVEEDMKKIIMKITQSIENTQIMKKTVQLIENTHDQQGVFAQ